MKNNLRPVVDAFVSALAKLAAPNNLINLKASCRRMGRAGDEHQGGTERCQSLVETTSKVG